MLTSSYASNQLTFATKYEQAVVSSGHPDPAKASTQHGLAFSDRCPQSPAPDTGDACLTPQGLLLYQRPVLVSGAGSGPATLLTKASQRVLARSTPVSDCSLVVVVVVVVVVRWQVIKNEMNLGFANENEITFTSPNSSYTCQGSVSSAREPRPCRNRLVGHLTDSHLLRAAYLWPEWLADKQSCFLPSESDLVPDCGPDCDPNRDTDGSADLVPDCDPNRDPDRDTDGSANRDPNGEVGVASRVPTSCIPYVR